MGSPQNSPASPSLSRSSSGRRPKTLNLGGGNTSGSGKSPSSSSNSPTKSSKSPGSPATSTKGRSTPRRNGSLGKGSQVTRPVAPKLSTAARSLVRPCGCGKEGHGGHGNGHKDGRGNGHHAQDTAAHNHHASPTTERKERPKKAVRTPSTKAKSPPAQTPPSPTPPPPQTEEIETSSNNINDNLINSNNNNDDSSTQNPTQYSQVMSNRYISTLVWVPRMMTEKFSSTVLVTSDAPKFTDTVFIKPRYRELHHEERLLSSGTTVQTYTVQTTSPGLSTTTLALA